MYRYGALATASSFVATGVAQAQGLPPAPSPATNWTGFHIGINLGWARHYASTTDVNNFSGIPPANYVTSWFDSRKSTFSYGGQVGYTWQHQFFVVGVEADITQIGAKTTFAPARGPAVGCATCVASATNELQWLATFRGRAGIAFQQFLAFGTVGVAVGRLHNRWGFGEPATLNDSQFLADGTRTGIVYGGGLEYAFSRNWTLRGEALYVDFGTTSATQLMTNPIGGGGTPPFRTDFRNTSTIGRAALNYRW